MRGLSHTPLLLMVGKPTSRISVKLRGGMSPGPVNDYNTLSHLLVSIVQVIDVCAILLGEV